MNQQMNMKILGLGFQLCCCFGWLKLSFECQNLSFGVVYSCSIEVMLDEFEVYAVGGGRILSRGSSAETFRLRWQAHRQQHSEKQLWPHPSV